MIKIEKPKVSPSVMAIIKRIRIIAGITIIISLVAYPLAMLYVNITNPSSIYLGFLGDRGDTFSAAVGQGALFTIPIAVLLFGVANWIKRYHIDNNYPDYFNISIVPYSLLSIILWVPLSLISSAVALVIFFMMSLSR